MDSLFCLPQWSILLLSLTIAHHITRLPIWVELHLRIKKRSFFFFMKTPLFPSYLTGLDWDGKEGLIEGKCLFLGVKVSYLTSICACVCVGVCGCERETVCVGAQSKMSPKTHRFSRHHRQTRFSSTLDIICIKMWHCHFFSKKIQSKKFY